MSALQGRRILLGVTGGIAAYKAPDLVRRLRDAGAEVRVAMTAGAMEFVRPLTFQAVSGQPVHHDLLDPAAEAAMGHIELARWADTVLVAPTSANFMARLAHGMADDLLTTLCLATDATVVLAPAMNRLMWANAATQANRELLESRGAVMLGPGSGDQACGEVGDGRMLEPLEIVSLLAGIEDSGGPLEGETVLVTVGPTREAVDPVRFISNRSSGRMGFAVAAAARKLGARVIAVAGPCGLPTPPGVERVDVETAQAMYEAVMTRAAESSIFVGAAAVADYRPEQVPEEKIKKQDETMTLRLVKNPDILQSVAALERPPFTAGFAAETHDLQRYAEEKRRRKGLDMIAANWVGGDGGGFDSADNALEVSWEGGGESLGRQSKESLADALMRLVAERYHERRKAANT